MKKLLLISIAAISLIVPSSLEAMDDCRYPCCNMADLTQEQLENIELEELRRACALAGNADLNDGYHWHALNAPPIPPHAIPPEPMPNIYRKWRSEIPNSARLKKADANARKVNWMARHNCLPINNCSFIFSSIATLGHYPFPSKKNFTKWDTRLYKALFGAFKTSILVTLHTIWQDTAQSAFVYHTENPIVHFNGPKTFCLYVMLDLIHKYGSDIAAKSFPSINKCDNTLRKHIKYYDTLKNKLGWLTKASIAAYQSHVYL